jgi:hypothetical protein
MAQRKKDLWLIGLNLKDGTVEIHRNDPNNSSQVSHLTGVIKYYGYKVPKAIKDDYLKIIGPITDLKDSTHSE